MRQLAGRLRVATDSAPADNDLRIVSGSGAFEPCLR